MKVLRSVINPIYSKEVRTIADARVHSARWLDAGLIAIGAAFNLTDDARIRFGWDADTCRRVERLCVELVRCANIGSLQLRAGAVAQDDQQLQRFLAAMAASTPNSK